MQTQTQPYDRVGQYQTEPPPLNNQKGLSAASVLLPLRLFLGVSFIAAGLDKLTDKDFLDPTAITYIGNQLAAFSKQSPIGSFLTSVAVPNATIFGALVMAGELAIGLGTLVGLFSRTAAFFGFLLSMTLWLTATWEVAPFFLGSDLPYAIGWLTLALAGAHPIFSLDGQIRKWLAQRKQDTAVLVQGAPADSGIYAIDAAALNLNDPADQPTLARRRFITVAGATVLVGAVSGLAWKNSLDSKSQAAQSSAGGGQASSAIETPGPTTAPATSIPTTAPAVATTTAPAANPTANAPTTTAATTSQPATAPATATNKPTTAAAPATTQAATKAPTTVATAKGPVLAALSSIAVGDAKAFTTPDTKQPAYLVHLADGSVKAFSAICTHEGCEVSYSKSNQLFVCPCHGAQFDATSGAAVRRPARTALKSYKVQVDNGNIIYVQG